MHFLPQIDYPIEFPDKFRITREGIAGIGGNLLPETLINAYSKGLFPWYAKNDPILWWHPEPRLVLFPDKFHCSKNVRKLFNRCVGNSKRESAKTNAEKPLFYITINQNFKAVIQECAAKRGPGREDTWINHEIISSYTKLHEMGFAHSVEVWQSPETKSTSDATRKTHGIDDETDGETDGRTQGSPLLVGGLYGMALGKIFFGESMFSHVPDASKLALCFFCERLKELEFVLIDCQVETAHLKSLGAETISRRKFLEYLKLGNTNEKNPAKISFV